MESSGNQPSQSSPAPSSSKKSPAVFSSYAEEKAHKQKQAEKENRERERTHEKNKNFKNSLSTKPKIKNISQFISLNEDKIKNLLPEYKKNDEYFNKYIYDVKKTKWSNEKQANEIYYKFDKNFKNLEHTKKQIIKFIMKLFYNFGTYGEKINLHKFYMVLELSSIRTPIFYFGNINNIREEGDKYPINYVYNWILSTVRNHKIIEYNKILLSFSYYIPSQPAEPNPLILNCNICGEDVEYREIIKNCPCNVSLCISCYNNLNPRKCPICRKLNFTYTNLINEPIPEKIGFRGIYNNRQFQKIQNLEDLEENFYFYDEEENDINNFNIEIKTENDLIKDYVKNSLSEYINYYNADFVYNYFEPRITRNIFNIIMKHGESEDIHKDLYELFKINDIDPEDTDEERTPQERAGFKRALDFVSHCLNVDGLQAINKEDEFLFKKNIFNVLTETEEPFYFFIDDYNSKKYFEIRDDE